MHTETFIHTLSYHKIHTYNCCHDGQVAANNRDAKIVVKRNLVAAALKGLHAVALMVRGNIVIVVINILALTMTMYR